MKISRYAIVIAAMAVLLAGVSNSLRYAHAGTEFSYNIPTYDLKNYSWSVRAAVQKWDVHQTEIDRLLRHFFGLEGGIYTDDLAKGFRKTPAGLPSVFDQADMMYLPVNERILPNGDRMLVSDMQHATYSRRYLILKGPLDHLQVAAVGLTYFFAPPGGYVGRQGLDEGVRMRLEDRPSLVIFYPESSGGRIVRNRYLESIITDEVEQFFRGFFSATQPKNSEARLTIAKGKPLLERVIIKGVKVRTSQSEMMPR